MTIDENQSTEYPNSNVLRSQRLEIMRSCFEQVSALIRNSPAVEYDEYGNKIKVPDSTRLQLYGYYKCAIAVDEGDLPVASKRPSFFDPVGRAKFDAWVECRKECKENMGLAMEKYVEIAAALNHTLVGRKCEEIYQNAMENIRKLAQTSQDSSFGVVKKTNGRDHATEKAFIEKNEPIESDDVSLTREEEKNDINNKQMGHKTDDKSDSEAHFRHKWKYLPYWVSSFLPPPLIPRGQLDLSFADFFFALFHCTLDALYRTFFGGGLVHRFFTYILPSFAMALINIVVASFHPLQRIEKYEKLIAQRWMEMENGSSSYFQNNGEVIVGLSVRSLFDLYLSAQSYPSGSEIVIVPPVTIPGMIDIVKHHGLELVPVDIPSIENDAQRSSNEGPTNPTGEDSEDNMTKDGKTIRGHSFEDCNAARWGIDVESVKAAVTQRTVAIFVVHPFGTVIANHATMKALRTVANDHALELWEDCAQCYTGQSTTSKYKNPSKDNSSESSFPTIGYMGSSLSNACFFSFGPIKTATALGGGLAILRSAQSEDTICNTALKTKSKTEIADKMRRIQNALLSQQSNYSYCIRILKCFAVHLVSHSRLVCGAMKSFLGKIGINYDEFVIASLRGFASASRLGEKPSISYVRRRPCPALLAMIHRRLCDSANTEKNSRERLRRYGMLRKQISDNLIKQNLDADRVIFPKRIDGSSMHGWIFPILVQSPSKTSKLLLKLGYDAPCGMTQLKPVTNSESRVSATFKKILYLPLPSQNFSTEDENNLTAALDYVISKTYCEETSTSDNIRNERTRQVTKKRKSVQQYHFAYLLLIGLVHLEWVFSVFGLFHSKLLKIAYCCILQTARMLLLSTGICLAITLLLCQYMGPVYLKSSNTFAKYCDMVFESPFCDAGIEVEENDAEGQQKKIFTQSKSALNLDFTSVPQRNTRVPDSSPSLHECSGDLQKALLTGVTGFVGSLLMRELLLHRHSLMIPGGVVVIVRSKRGKSAQERIDQLLSHSMFDFLTNLQKASLVQVVEGDVTLSDCGMQDADAKSIRTLNISHVFHCAAAVSFTQTMEDAAVSNITSSLQMRSLTRKLSNKNAKFVYISTAFVHGRETGTKTEPLPETLFSLHPYDPLELYKSMLGTQSYASAAMNALGFPNTYTFSKCICEHLLHGENDQNTLIIRPSIVGPSVQEPFEGWAGEKPSTIVAAACLYLKFPYNIWSFGKETVPFVPVDVLCRAIIARAFICLDPDVSGIDGAFSDSSADYENEEKKESLQFDHSLANYPRKYIVTVAWDASSHESASFSWLSYAYTITHMGSLCGHVHRVVAYSGLLLSTKLFPRLKFSLDAFDLLHSLLIRTPIDALLRLCDKLPWKPEFAQELKMLGQVLDLPLVFFPFANQSFYFRSELSPPGDFNSERYMFSCVVAAHRFIRRIEAKRRKHSKYYNSLNFREYPNYVCNSVKADRNISSIVVAGAEHTMPFSDFWWALTQPQGSIFIRFLGWILAKVFRHTVTEVEIDVASFVEYARTLSTLSKSDRPNVIIAPTHRSLYDFLIVSYICFSLPELGLEMPHIAAASEFSRIPIIGWIASKAGAFFVKRGEAKKDPNLSKTLSLITQSPTFIEVFIEGKRSRHRTFLAPKTGFLRCLAESNCNYIVLPMTINYEELPDQTSLVNEANGNRGSEMSLSALMNWSIQAFSGRINVGRIFISVSKAINGLNMNSKDPQYLGCCIQNHQQRRIVISEFHVRAASQAINIPPKLISNALSSIGCCHWPEWRDKGQFNQMPTDLAVQWSNLLHFGHALAPYLPSTHSQWALWLSPSNLLFGTKVQSNEIVDSIVSKIVLYFDAAEKAANDVINMLKEKGFSKPNENHVMQQLPNDGKVPLFLMKVAVKILIHGTKYTTLTKNTMRVTGHEEKVSCVEPLFHLDVRRLREQKTQVEPIESFGAWGYSDSYFVLNFRRDGTKFVSMKGRRYSICGKEIPGLVNFIEQELQVDITPNSLTLPPVPELNGVPDSDLTSEEFSQIAFTVNNDHNRLSTNTVDRARHGTGHTLHDMFNLRSGSIKIRLPDVVVWPKNEEELSSIISIATQRNWCVIPFGGGTNVTHANHCPEKLTDTRRMISVDMKLMNQILWVNEEDGLAHVEAGITGLHLIEQMNKRGFTIGHEPDSYEFSTLGGWIATKASGMKQNKYGNIEDIVKEVRVVGAKFNLSQKHKLNKVSFGRVSNGVDLKSLMLGSEGCLGIITSAVIKIWPIAETKQFESVLLPNFDAGLKFVKELSKMRTMKPASARLLDNDQFRLGQALKEAPTKLESLRQVASKSLGQYFGNFDGKSVVCATITFEGSCSEVKLQRKNVQMLAVNHGGLLAGPKVGKAGYDLTFAIAYLRDFAMNYSILGESFETFVPWSKLTQVVMATKKRIYEEHKNRSLPGKPFVCSRITQLYDEGACVYFYFCMNSDGVLEPSNVYAEIESCARQEILNNGGSLSHHHGLGKLRSQFVSQIFNDGYVNSIIAIKKAMDPMNTFGARNGVFSNIPINSSTGMEHQRKSHLDK